MCGHTPPSAHVKWLLHLQRLKQFYKCFCRLKGSLAHNHQLDIGLCTRYITLTPLNDFLPWNLHKKGLACMPLSLLYHPSCLQSKEPKTKDSNEILIQTSSLHVSWADWAYEEYCLLAFMVKSPSQCSYFLPSLPGFEFFFLLFGAMVGSTSLGHQWQLDQDPVFTTSLLFGFLLQKNGFTAYMVTLAVYYLVWKWVLSLSLLPAWHVCFAAMYQMKHKIYTRRSSCVSIHALYIGFFAAMET